MITAIENFLANDPRPLLVLLGPTASGKTALSLKLAKQFNCEIISADSRQVYRHMDIGTDKILPEAREGIPHHLIDVADPDERFTVADFKQQAETAIEDILSRGKIPLLTGGTGLYIDALLKNFSLPPENPELRLKLTRELEEFGNSAMHKKLAKLDPASAERINPQNIPYIIRALEIIMTTGKPKNDLRAAPRWHTLTLGLAPQKEILHERIARRVDEQISRGLAEETRGLLSRGYGKNLSAMRTLGYREMTAHLEGAIAFYEAAELIKKNTCAFARRQMIWFKRDKNILWSEGL